MTTDISLAGRLPALRAAIRAAGLDGLIIPRSDEYLGEYVPACAERLAWTTGFTGSAGMAIVLADRAAVFSDGRYVTQLDHQVDGTSWERLHSIDSPARHWLAANAPAGGQIGYDARTMSRSAVAALMVPDAELVPTGHNLVDQVWTDRPAPPAGAAVIHPLHLAGEAALEKRTRLAAQLAAKEQDATILGDPLSVAWLLNLRGDDVPCTPVALMVAILHHDATVDLFADAVKLPQGVRDWLGDGVRIHTPDQLQPVLSGLSGCVVATDAANTPIWYAQILEEAGATVVMDEDPCIMPRACKNAVEQEGARAAHLRDAVALCSFLHWLDHHAHETTELDAVDRLSAFRAQYPDYRGESFETISGAGPNGAVIHYRVTPETDRLIGQNTVYLSDSGGQYPDGTTDVTRTIWTGPGEPPESVRRAYTAVLKGNLRLGRAVFPRGITGQALDALAREALWQEGLDFDHGTGHGVGSFLSVHEGPVRISKVPGPVPLLPGMIVSNEPGYYEPGGFGIRLETLLLVRDHKVGPDGRQFLAFDTLTLAPFDRRLIDVTLLGPEDTAWLDAYHARVMHEIAPKMPPDSAAWLIHACSPINRK